MSLPPSPILARVFDGTLATERWQTLFRIWAASPVLALVVFLDRDRLPYWELALVGFAVLLLGNLLFLRLLRQGRRLTVATLSTLLDTALLLGISSRSISSSAALDSTSDLWLVYPLVIILAAFRLRPVFNGVYQLLLATWYGAHVAILFSPTSRTYAELPIRLGFFLLIGAAVTAMAHSLRHEREENTPAGPKEQAPFQEQSRSVGPH